MSGKDIRHYFGACDAKSIGMGTTYLKILWKKTKKNEKIWVSKRLFYAWNTVKTVFVCVRYTSNIDNGACCLLSRSIAETVFILLSLPCYVVAGCTL